MKKSLSLVLTGLLALIAMPGCKSKTPPTALKLKVSAENQVDFEILKLGVRTIDEDSVSGFDKPGNPEISIQGRNLAEDPYLLELSPSLTMSNKIAICARGISSNMSGINTIMRGIAVATFIPGVTTEVNITLRDTLNYPDSDGDCFSSQDPDPNLIDCNDNNFLINPFVNETCNNGIDENCNGTIDESCSCEEGMTRPCYDLSDPNMVSRIGKGICQFGFQRCNSKKEWGSCEGAVYPSTEEICGDGLDNDCNGSVDEGCECTANTFRYCFNSAISKTYKDGDTTIPEEILPQLQFSEESPEGTIYRKAKSLTGSGYCVARTQHCIITAGLAKWGRCGGDNAGKNALPNSVLTDDGIPVYMESACDGIDEDCDGQTDENREYNNATIPYFDNDHDGYTTCGTRHDGVTGVTESMIDCNDNDSNIHPEAREICENNIDENCLFEWGPRAGLPNTNFEQVPEADLVCNQQTISIPDLSCESGRNFYYGYVAQEVLPDGTQLHDACHFNNAVFWQVCKDNGSCATENDCLDIKNIGSIAEGRPLCSTYKAGTCSGTIDPVWQAIPLGEDKYEDCGPYDCDCVNGDNNCQAHYYGIGKTAAYIKKCKTDFVVMSSEINKELDADRLCDVCFYAKDVTEQENLCDGNSECLNDALCTQKGVEIAPEERKGICKIISQRPSDEGQCTGLREPIYVNAPFGTDPFSQCVTKQINCSNFYYGWNNNKCMKGGIFAGLCNGSGECITSDTNIREICKNPDFITSEDNYQEHLSCGSTECRNENTCKAGDDITSTHISDLCYTSGQHGCKNNEACNSEGKCTLVDGQSCNANADCNSGHCVDGVCCNVSACGECQACNINGLGTCSNVGQGKQDDTCSGNNEQCDGKGNCLYNDGITCSSDNDCLNGHCVDKVCCNEFCNEPCKACNLPGSVGTCSYVRDAIDEDTCNQLGTGCNDGITGAKCKCSNSETPSCLRENGIACNNNSQCLSGFCADGFCCNSACNGTCETCASNPGTCSAVAAGQGDSDSCPKQTECDGRNILEQHCDNTKRCVKETQTTCKNGQCTTESGEASCPGTCSSNEDCSDGQYCASSDHKCHGKLDNGATCDTMESTNDLPSTSCKSGNCVDDVCCGSSSCDTCQACNINHVGTCTFVTVNENDDDTCNTADKKCNGKGECVNILGQACGDDDNKCLPGNYCVDGVCCATDNCGTCESCNVEGFAGRCHLIEADSTDPGTCEAPKHCDASGKCGEDLGDTCKDNSDCLSGHCVDGVCCDSSSCELCKSCDIDGHKGSCWYVPVNKTDNNCNGENQFCDGSGACKTTTGTHCFQSSDCLSGHCVSGICCDTSCNTPDKCENGVTVSYSCNTGSCKKNTDEPCSPYSCNTAGTNCYTTCTNDTMCQAGHYCDIGSKQCKPQETNGATCTKGNQCESGHCVDGVCCNTGCTDTCMTCNNSSSKGICSFVQEQSTDPDTCIEKGKQCDGAGNCLKIRGQSCTLDNDCLSGHCIDSHCCENSCDGTCMTCNNSSGTCQPVAANRKDNVTCNGANEVCDGSGHCELVKGTTCNKNDDCLSGHCVDNVCCSDEVCPICAACNISGHLGDCSPLTQGSTDDTCNDAGKVCNGKSGAGSCLNANGQTCSSSDDCKSNYCVKGICCDTACNKAPVCENDQLTVQVCNAEGHVGTCISVGPTPCEDHRACNSEANACQTTCSLNMHCADGYYCSNGTCVNLLPDGSNCTAGNQCSGGYCTAAGKCSTSCGVCETGLQNNMLKCANVQNGEQGLGCTDTGFACKSGKCLKLSGQRAADVNECLSGIISADGYCCNKACNGSCQTCASGTCENVPAFTSTNTCNGDKTCTASGICLAVNGQSCTSPSACASGICEDGFCLAAACPADSCSANTVISYKGSAQGTCQSTTTTCSGNLICKNGACLNKCTANSDCYGNTYCNSSGQCVPKLAASSAKECSATLLKNSSDGANSMCASGHCVDGFCCNTACNIGDSCIDSLTMESQACNKPGSEGTCTSTSNACGNNSCTGNTMTTIGCQNGACYSLTSTCPNNLKCNSSANACITTCSDDDDCIDGYYCGNSGACLQKIPTGGICNNTKSGNQSDSCQSGHCVDNVCCATECNGLDYCNSNTAITYSCAVPGKFGSCETISTPCGTDSCSNGILTTHTCESGACTTATEECAPFKCDSNGTACANSCTDNNQCAYGAFCNGDTCLELKGLAKSCTYNYECQSGYCGLNGTCVENCGTCAYGIAFMENQSCQPVPQYNPGYNCTDPGMTCDGHGKCIKQNGQSCSNKSDCASGFCIGGICCNNQCQPTSCSEDLLSVDTQECSTGTCTVTGSELCGAYKCTSGKKIPQCNSSCENDNDCSPGHTCKSKSCI